MSKAADLFKRIARGVMYGLLMAFAIPATLLGVGAIFWLASEHGWPNVVAFAVLGFMGFLGFMAGLSKR